VYQKDELVFWQGRLLRDPSPGHPKYSNQFQAGRLGVYFTVEDIKGERVVVVEDILSAIRVGKVCDCYALLSAHVSDAMIFALKAKYKEVMLWLDPDKAEKMTKWVMRYRSFGVNVRSIKTNRDPKFYNEDSLKYHIGRSSNEAD
jgi:5S rRNA maturation endonuclease (ribonuclease M5)